jgi:anthranilate synthase component 1
VRPDAFDIPADLDTPVSAFMKLRPLRPRFLLESVEGGERLARYSFIGFGDALKLDVDGDGIRIDGEHRGRAGSPAELLATLREALARAPRPVPVNEESAGLPPLAGGLVGVSGYGLAAALEPALAASAPPAPERLASYLAPRSLLVFDHVRQRLALLHDGSAGERGALREEIVRALRGPVPASRARGSHGEPSPTMSRGAYGEGVERAKRAIHRGDVYQLVLSVGFRGACDLEPFQVYRALRSLNPSPYLYFLDLGDVAVAGSSPEALVRLEGRRASLRPIAGTRPRGADAARDAALERELLEDPKEAAEHVMLVDLARNDVGRVAVPGSVTVDPYRVIERYSHVMHIVSGVHGVLQPEQDAFDLFAATFPAGTVVGAPKIRAMELIAELEPARRGLYAGTVGYFGAGGSMDQAIAIRTITFQDGEYAYQAGAGIVADSDPAREHDEVLAKSHALSAALGMAEEVR